MSRKILIVEDEEKIARFVELELVHEGYEVIKAFDGRTGLDLALSEHADLIVLDVMLPRLNGLRSFAVFVKKEIMFQSCCLLQGMR